MINFCCATPESSECPQRETRRYFRNSEAVQSDLTLLKHTEMKQTGLGCLLLFLLRLAGRQREPSDSPPSRVMEGHLWLRLRPPGSTAGLVTAISPGTRASQRLRAASPSVAFPCRLPRPGVCWSFVDLFSGDLLDPCVSNDRLPFGAQDPHTAPQFLALWLL